MSIDSQMDRIPDGWRLYTVDMSIEDRARVMLKGPMYVNAGGVSVPEYVCEVGTSLELAIAAAIRKAANTYRGWTISYDHPPIPIRDFDWGATGPNYDASYEGAEDGWVDNGEKVNAATREALIAEIDAWFDENPCTACDGEGRVWNNADPTSGQFHECECAERAKGGAE